MEEKRGPIKKGPKGWPINPLGVVALLIFSLIIIFLIARPLINKQTSSPAQLPGNAPGGRIVTPQAGEIIRSSHLSVEFLPDDPSKVAKVQFWVKTYADGTWQTIGEISSSPFRLDWEIPQSFQNKAVAITAHLYDKEGNITKDPGGWREGIIIFSP